MPVNEQYTKGVRLSLLQAGIYRLDAAKIFASVQLVSTVLFLGLGITLAVAMQRGILASLLLTMMLAFFGYYVPLVWLKRAISHRKKQVIRGLPDALDLMVVCVEAGLGLNAALLRVGEELGRHCPAVSQEFMLVNREMRAGVSRHDALRHLAQRNPVEDVQSFVAILIQTDKLGSSMSKTLRTQSDSLRGKRKQRAEEAAAKTSIKLLFPLVFFILPSLFVVLLGPGILQVIKAFSGNSLP
jgi:tight adherence protein C